MSESFCRLLCIFVTYICERLALTKFFHTHSSKSLARHGIIGECYQPRSSAITTCIAITKKWKFFLFTHYLGYSCNYRTAIRAVLPWVEKKRSRKNITLFRIHVIHEIGVVYYAILCLIQGLYAYDRTGFIMKNILTLLATPPFAPIGSLWLGFDKAINADTGLPRESVGWRSSATSSLFLFI